MRLHRRPARSPVPMRLFEYLAHPPRIAPAEIRGDGYCARIAYRCGAWVRMASAPRARMLTAFLFRLALTRRAARGDERKSLSTARAVLLFLALGALEAHPFRARVGFVGGLVKIERVETSCDVHNTLRQHPESELEIECDIYRLGNDRSSLFPSSLQNLRTKLQNLMGHQEAQSKGTAPSWFRLS